MNPKKILLIAANLTLALAASDGAESLDATDDFELAETGAKIDGTGDWTFLVPFKDDAVDAKTGASYPPEAQVIGWPHRNPDEKPIIKYLQVTPAAQKLALVVNNKATMGQYPVKATVKLFQNAGGAAVFPKHPGLLTGMAFNVNHDATSMYLLEFCGAAEGREMPSSNDSDAVFARIVKMKEASGAEEFSVVMDWKELPIKSATRWLPFAFECIVTMSAPGKFAVELTNTDPETGGTAGFSAEDNDHPLTGGKIGLFQRGWACGGFDDFAAEISE